MDYDGLVAECLVFTMTALRTHHEDWIRCNHILQISRMKRYHEKHLDALDCTAFSCHKEDTEQSCRHKKRLFLLQ